MEAAIVGISLYNYSTKYLLADEARLAYQSMGVVYGNIATGTPFVYSSTFNSLPSQADFIGALSLILWSITLVCTVQYAFIFLRADDGGEGGPFALYSLLSRYVRHAWSLPLVFRH